MRRRCVVLRAVYFKDEINVFWVYIFCKETAVNPTVSFHLAPTVIDEFSNKGFKASHDSGTCRRQRELIDTKNAKGRHRHSMEPQFQQWREFWLVGNSHVPESLFVLFCVSSM